MSTRLQDFREQYPQYNDVDDENLAEGIRQKFYPDLDVETYRSEIGLGPSAWTKYPTDPDGFMIDPTRPEIKNKDGSSSTERTIGIEMDGRQYNVPTIVDGEALDPQDPEQMQQIVGSARDKIKSGWKFPSYESIEEAEAGAQKRSNSLMSARQKWQTENSPPPSIWDRVESMWEKGEQTIANVLEPEQSPRADFEPDQVKRDHIKGQADPIYQPPVAARRYRGALTTITKEAEERKQPRARLTDQIFAGYDEYQANDQTSQVFDALENYDNAAEIATGQMSLGGQQNTGATGAELDDKILAARAKYGNKEQRAEAQALIDANTIKIEEEQVQLMQKAIDKGRDLRTRAATVPFHKETMDVLEAETFGGGVSEFADDPIMITAELSLRSLPNMVEAIPLAIGGAMLAGPPGFIAGMGTGSAMVEYRAAFSDFLQKNNVDINDARSLIAAGRDKDLMNRAREYATTRSTIIGTANAFGAGIATKPLTPFISNLVGRELSNVALQTVVQTGLEGTGELGAQLATDEYAPGEVLAEMAGSISQAPIEVGAAAVLGTRAQTRASQIAGLESEVNQILGRGTGPDDSDAPSAAPTMPPVDPFMPQEPEAAPRETPPAPPAKPPIDVPTGEPTEAGVDVELEPQAAEPDITMAEVERVQDIPTTEKMERATAAVGEAAFRAEVDRQRKNIDPQTTDQEALAVEAAAINILVKENRRLDRIGEVPGDEFFPQMPPAEPAIQPEAQDDVQYFDQRLKRHFYRAHLLGMADELTPGGGVAHVWEGNHIVGRTPSVNPDWFKNMNQDPDYRMSVDQVQKAINKAVTGKKLGVREQRVVQALTDGISDERLAQVDYAKEDLQRARDLRSKRRSEAGMQPDPDAAIAGERYDEDEYTPDMSADSRIIFELMEQAVGLGVDEGILERLSIQYDDSQNQELMNALEGVIDEHRQQAGTQTAAAKQAPRPKTEQQGDIFGADPEQQAIADEIRRRDAARVAGQDSIETGDPSDLFSEAGRQVDIEDQVLAARQVPPNPKQQNQAEVDPLHADRERRVRSMSMQELMDAMYTDPMTGIGNRLAFDQEIDGHNFVASIDADSLKWINDNLGHDAGDALLIAVADALKNTGLDAYRIGGDEFYIGGGTHDQVQAGVALAEGILANQTLSSPNGSKAGIEVTAGIGTDKASADSRMEVEKKRKKGRAGRGEAPQGATLSHKAGPVLDMNPGTNYIPTIGQTGSLPIDAQHNLILGSTGKAVRIPKKPVRREHILAVMQKYFGKRIYQGRVQGKMRLGFYRPGQGELRLKKHNDIEVAAHEIAHWLDDRYPWIKQLYMQHLEEVKSVSYDVKLNYEGYAEFMRLWFTQESEAMQRAPSYYDAFNKSVKEKSPQMWAMLTDLQELMHAWHMQGSRARGASKHGNADPSFFERVRELFPVNIYQRALDGLRSIKTIAADLSDISGPIITDAYERLRLATGGVNGVIEAAFFFGTPKWRADGRGIELGGESLREIFGDEWGSNEVAMYMIARRAEELLGQGRENLMRPDEIAAWLQYGDQHPELADMFTRYQAYNNRILDFAEASGILNPVTRAAFQEMNKNYVPFNRIIESKIQGKKVQAGGNPWQRLSGGTQNIANIWENIIGNSGHIIRMSMVNDGKRVLFRELSKGGRLGGTDRNAQAGIYAAPIPKETKPNQVDSEQVLKKAAEAMGVNWRAYQMAKETGMYPAGPEGDYLEAMVAIIDSMADGLGDMVTFWNFGQDPKGDDVDFYMHNGDKYFMQINDPDLMDSLRYLGPKASNLVLAIGGGFSATLRRGVVAVPVFQMKNFVRDTANAWLLSTHVKVPAGRALRVVFSRMSKDPAYIEMLLNGGGFANRSQGLQAQRKVIVDPTRLAAIYDRFMGRFENANRLAEYKANIAAGESPRRAALASREISTDFAMRGSSEAARFLAVLVPFLNARVQGLYRVKRQFDRKELAVSYALRGLALAGATLALYAYNKDDDRYKQEPEDKKDLYLYFYTGAGEDDYFMLPKPFESGMIWQTIPERMMQYAEDENGKEFADALLWMFLETFNMDMTPQVFQPLMDLQKNKKFTGAPIVPRYLENVEPTEQYTYYTSIAVREAAQAMGVSPIKMEHILRGYLGTLGTYAIAAADATITAAVDAEDLQFGERPSRGDSWRENIITKALIDPLVQEGPPRRTKYTTDLWDMVREAEKVAGTVALHQKRNLLAIEEYLNDPEKMVQFGTNAALSAARVGMGEIRVQIDLVRQAPASDMTADEKRLAIWELTRERNKLAREAAIGIKQAQDEEEQRLAQEQQQEQQQVAAGAQ